MSEKTATQVREDQQKETRLHSIHRRFHDKWAPREGHMQSDFQADLAMLMREVHRDAIEPFVEAASIHLSTRPMTSMFINPETSDT